VSTVNSSLKQTAPNYTFLIDCLSTALPSVFSALCLTPLDHACFLSGKHKRSLFLLENFSSPYQGASHIILQRILASSTYFLIQSQMGRAFYSSRPESKTWSSILAPFVIGITAGSIRGVLASPFDALKNYVWIKNNASFQYTFESMWHNKSDYKFLFRGTKITAARDALYGCIYESLRQNHASSSLPHTVWSNISAAWLATALTSPLNYIRATQYEAPLHEPTPTPQVILSKLWNESKKHTSATSRLRFFSHQLGLGWGVSRTIGSVLIGQKLFDCTREQLEEYEKNTKKPSF